MKTKLNKRVSMFDIFNYSMITLFSLIIIYPLYYVVINSVDSQLFRGPTYLLPRDFTYKNYEILFQQPLMINAFIISSLRTIIGTLSSVFVCAAGAFVLRKKHISFRNFYLILLTIPMFFGGGLIPYFLLLNSLGLLDNFLVYIIPGLSSFWIIIILMSSFNGIPDALEESAKIDGAGYFLIFYKIFIPLSLPALATVSLFIGVGQWNSWFDTVYFTSSPKLMTLPAILIRAIAQNNVSQEIARSIGLNDMQRNVSPEGIKMATMIVTITPILFSYPFLQRYFIKGVMIGSIKG